MESKNAQEREIYGVGVITGREIGFFQKGGMVVHMPDKDTLTICLPAELQVRHGLEEMEEAVYHAGGNGCHDTLKFPQKGNRERKCIRLSCFAGEFHGEAVRVVLGRVDSIAELLLPA